MTTWKLPFVLLFPAVYWLTQQWPSLSETTGHTVMKKYREQDLTLKGWRSTSAMGHHIQNQVTRLSVLNAYILMAMK